LCESKGIYLIMDDIYHKLVFDGNHAVSAYKFTNKDIETTRVITLNGVSKLYGMTGYRIGWTIANRRLVEVMTNVQAQTTSCAPVVNQAAAEGALTGVQSVVEDLRLFIQNNRDVMMHELRSFTDIRVNQPDGTFYIMPDFRAYTNDSIKLANFLLEKALVVAVPGKPFGMDGHLRMSFAGPTKSLIEAVERMKWALDPNAPNEIYIGDRKLTRDWM
jgi:aspartate aminotransferase